MYLKKVEIFGFKSFADKTEIVFERGVTCVVGPNGCGKSNISDSIRWVLGERSAKLLRGAKMEDVIFAGTEFRKPLNLAEVSLTIDNADQKLPIQYEEVVITRRLHRSGESEYLLNRTPCRLKDIQDLILDTGIGSNSYSMIEQGRIDHILNAEAEERRFLIEEAAGISKYKVKKEEALRKLERTEQNLLRLNDITSEVERNIKYAERQAQRAERYKEQFERLKTLEIKRAFFETSTLDEQLALLNQERTGQQIVLDELEERARGHNVSARQIEEKLQKLEASFFEEESARSEAKHELSTIEAAERFHQEKIEFLKLANQKALGEIEILSARCITLTSDLASKDQEKTILASTIAELKTEKQQLEARLAEFKQETVSEEELARQQSILFDLAHQLSELRNSIHKIEGELVALERTKANLNETHQKLSETKGSYALRHDTIHIELTDYEKSRSEIEAALNEENQKRERFEQEIKQLRSDLDEIRAQKAKLESNIKLLEELDHAYGSNSKEVSEFHDKILKGATKSLLDCVRIQSGYELAVEAALADALGAVITDSVETAAHLIEALNQSDLKQAAIYIKDQVGSVERSTPNHSLLSQPVLDVIDITDGYEGILNMLLAKAFIIDELNRSNIFELAPLAQDLKLVTKTGNIFGPQFQIQFRKGGYTPERSALARNEQRSKLANLLISANQLEQNLSAAIEENEFKMIESKTRERALNAEILVLHSSLKQHEGTLSSFNEYVKQVDDEIALTLQELKTQSHEIGHYQNRLSEANHHLAQLELKETKEKEYIRLIEDRIESSRHAKTEIENKLLQLETKISLSVEKEDSLQKTVVFLSVQLNENTQQIQTLTEERAKSFSQLGQLQEELTGFGIQKEIAEKRFFEHSVKAEQLKRERTEVSELRNRAVEDAQVTARELESLRQKFHQYSLREMELGHGRNSISQELQSRYKLSLSAFNAVDYSLAPEELEEVRAEIEKLREKLDSIGTVNLLAIEEYQELKERFDLLLNQKRDLTESKEALLEAIRKINRTTKKLFEDTLIRVRESFREYYRVLFGGGYADLILIDEQNPFESGLDIIARPPGKKPQHISLLSGGEKALTAIALLLSLFSVKPSPFCVLDEVDAPLDEANNDRFINVLKPFLETTQFIIVTHSRKTISVGDALYGVTMQEPGVSKLVSVKLAHDESIEHSDAKVASELNQILN